MKKYLSLLLTAIILLAALPISAFAILTTEPPYEIGDVNCDETLDMFDYLLIKSIYFEEYVPDEAQKELADINGDNSIDMFDYLLIKRAYFTNTPIKSPEKPEWDETAREIEFAEHQIEAYIPDMHTANVRKGNEHPATLITTKEQLDGLVSLNTDFYWDADGATHSKLEDFADSLDEDFFEEKALIAVQVAMSSGGQYYDIVKITADESGITVALTYLETIYSAPDVVVVEILFAEVDKNEALGCPDAKVTIEQLFWPFGEFGSYDATPRDIPYTEYSFNRVDERYFDPEKDITQFARPSFMRYSSSLLSLANRTYDYGAETADFAEYAWSHDEDIDEEYFYNDAIMYVYAASADSRSVFSVSSVRAGEDGITVTVNHELVDTDSMLPVFTMLMLEFDKADISGCQRFKVVFEGEPIVLPESLPEPSELVDPCPELSVDHQTPENTFATEDEIIKYTGTGLYPLYVQLEQAIRYSYSSSDPIKAAGMKVLLLDENRNIIDYSYTNSNGIARFVAKLDTRYYLGFEGDDNYYAMGIGTDNGERFGFIKDDQYYTYLSFASIVNSPRFVHELVLWERTEDLLRYEFHIYDITTGMPVENVYYKHNNRKYIHSDENGVLVLNAFFGSQGETHITLQCDGYKDKVVILNAPEVQDVYTVYMYPEE